MKQEMDAAESSLQKLRKRSWNKKVRSQKKKKNSTEVSKRIIEITSHFHKQRIE